MGGVTELARPATRPTPGGLGLSPAFAAMRATPGLAVALFGLAGLGWWWTTDRMRGMDNGPWSALGTASWFLAVWVVMMAAMMLPSVAPTVALYARMTKQRSPLLLFALGVMSVVWMAFVAGLVAIEKTLPWRRLASYGTALLLFTPLGALVLVAPDLIPALTIPHSHMQPMGRMSP